MIRDFIRIKNIKSSDFLYTIATFLNYNPGKERSKIQKKVKKAEEDLAVKEAKLDELKAELMKPEYQSSYSKLTEIQNEIDALEEEILIDMEAWEELSSQLEALG